MPDNPSVVITEVTGGIATVTLNRPDKRNAMNRAVVDSLRIAFDVVRDDPAVRCIVVRGAGPLFSSGIDTSFLFEPQPAGVPPKHMHHDMMDVFHRLERMERPTVAVIHGAAVGMALELALACDFRLALAGSVMGLPEVMFGIVPDVGGTTRLVRTVGVARAKELILTGKLITAATAERIGLVTSVAADEAALEAELARLTGQLAYHPAVAVGMAKTLIQQSAEVNSATSFELEGTVVNALGLIPQPDDLAERARAFMKEQMANPA